MVSTAVRASCGSAKSSAGSSFFNLVLVIPKPSKSSLVIAVFSSAIISVNNSRCAPSLLNFSSLAIASSNAAANLSGYALPCGSTNIAEPSPVGGGGKR